MQNRKSGIIDIHKIKVIFQVAHQLLGVHYKSTYRDQNLWNLE